MGKVSPVIMHAHCNNNNNSVVILSYRGFYKQAVHQLRFIEEVYFHPLGVEKGTLAQCIHHLGCLPTAPSGRVGALGQKGGYTYYTLPVSYTHLRAHETPEHLVCRLLLEKKKKKKICHSSIL
eukprot:TRINITY_DN7525_c0_g1_i9.p1 TRINITY_DN7525_c0_g1~~TRINITY_DN7525_c0_g1_i9.p1  ORF type:complete len:123 (+),score=16.98 TRINITY_DN7525_c0_g1_i9:400-768(+)